MVLVSNACLARHGREENCVNSCTPLQHTGNKEVKHLDWDAFLAAMVPSTTACPQVAAWSTFPASHASQRTLNLVSGQAGMGHGGWEGSELCLPSRDALLQTSTFCPLGWTMPRPPWLQQPACDTYSPGLPAAR